MDHTSVAIDLLSEYPNPVDCRSCGVCLFEQPADGCSSFEHLAVYLATGFANPAAVNPSEDLETQ